jgi:hypothetical protein
VFPFFCRPESARDQVRPCELSTLLSLAVVAAVVWAVVRATVLLVSQPLG